MVFPLLGTKVEISDGRRNYIHILNDFYMLANEADKEFQKVYDETVAITFSSVSYFKKWAELFDANEDMGEKRFIFPQIKKVKNYLGKYGIYTMTDTQIYDEVFLKSDLKISQFRYQAEQIFEDAFDESSNDMSLVGKRIRSYMEKHILNRALRNDVMSLCNFTLNKLNSEKVLEIEYFYKQECEEAEAIFTNLKELDIPVEKQKELAARLIELDARQREYYVYIFKMFDCAKYEIFRIAQYLNIDLSEYVDKDIEKRFDLSIIQSEEDAQQMYKELQEVMQNYGLDACKKQEALSKILNYYDVQARTYQGILFDSRELRSQAEQEDVQLKELCGEIEDLDKQKCTELLCKISDNHYLPEISQGYIEKINARIDAIELDIMLEMCLGMEEMSEQECNTLKDRIQEIDAREENKIQILERVDQRIYSIWDEEDFQKFSQLYCNTHSNDSVMVEKNMKLIAETGRTESKKLFLNAMNQMQNMQTAAEYIFAKESGGLKALFSSGKEDAYITMTIGGRVMHPELLSYMDVLRTGKGKKKGFFSKMGGFGQSAKGQKSSEGVKVSEPSKAVSKKYCTECGSQIDSDARFCSVCGAKQ